MPPPTPAAAKTERLLNLVICLLYTRRPLPKNAIRRAVAAYAEQESDEAFDRMFERDKDELRALGIPLVTRPGDPYFEDETAYRIDRREYALPEISFEPDELAALSLAARTWTQASLAASSAQALRKLAAAGVEPDAESMLGVEPRVRAVEAAFEPVKEAVVGTYPIRFDYRRSGGESRTRHVQPWGVVMWHGHWYLTGFDTDRDAPRVFRLSRISGAVARDGRPGAYEVPAGHDARAMVRRATGRTQRGEERDAELRVRAGQGHALRRRARAAADGADGSAGRGWTPLRVPFADVDRFAEELCWYGPDVVVDAPADLRAAVVDRLRAVVAQGDATSRGDAPERETGEEP